MKLRTPVVLAMTAILVLLACGQASGVARAPSFQEGMSFVSWWPGQYSHPDADLALAHLAETGAQWISLIVTQYQESMSAVSIGPTEATPTDLDLSHVIEQAHSLGLKVMLKPHLDLWSDADHWRGDIGQAFTTTGQWNAWFSSYRAFILHYADLAEDRGADQFCLGTELQGTTHRSADWRSIVADVRAHYSGPLVYAANWGGEETSLSWWDALDFIGVDAYYPLSSESTPSVEQLVAAWEPYAASLSALSENWGRQVLLTELGYRSVAGAAAAPWDWSAPGAVDLEAQARLYTAAQLSLQGRSWLAGVYWWAWETDPFDGGQCDIDYSPHDKPAEDVLRSWYAALPRATWPQPAVDRTRSLPVFSDSLAPGWEDWSWSATVDLTATAQAFAGRRSARVTLEPWGALSLWHKDWDARPYYYLEFYIFGARSAPVQLWAYVYDDPDTGARRQRPADDCRYTAGGTLPPGMWQRVLIPLDDLDARRGSLTRLAFQDRSGRGAEFWIDEICLLGSRWDTSLPLIASH